MAVAAAVSENGGARTVRLLVFLCALSMLPDADVIGFSLGVPYAAPCDRAVILAALQIDLNAELDDLLMRDVKVGRGAGGVA